MAFDAGWANMFGGRRKPMMQEPEEDPNMPKPVSIDWSSFEKPGPASTRYRQLLETMPERPEVPKGDSLAAGLVGFARNFTGQGKGEETYEALTQRPYHKLMEDYDRKTKMAHEAAALENQDRDDMAKVLMGRERANDRELGRYYEKKRLAAQIRGQDLENARGLARIRNDQADDAADNARADRELGLRGREVGVAEGNLKTRREELERDKTKDLLDFGTKSIKAISSGLPKTGKQTRGMSPSQQKTAEDLALRRLRQKNPEYYVQDADGNWVLRPNITPEERRALRKTQENLMSEITREWENNPPSDDEIDEDF